MQPGKPDLLGHEDWCFMFFIVLVFVSCFSFFFQFFILWWNYCFDIRTIFLLLHILLASLVLDAFLFVFCIWSFDFFPW